VTIDVPAVIPVTIPDVSPMVMLVLLLLQVPDGSVSESVKVPPIHTLARPLMAAGSGLTETAFVAAAVPQVLVTV